MARVNPTAAVTAGIMFGLAGGLVAGTYLLAPSLSGSPIGGVSDKLAVAEHDAAVYQAQAQSADSYIADIAEDTVRGRLADKPVVLITTPSVNEEDFGHIDWLSKIGGAPSVTRITLTDSFLTQDSAEPLKSLAATTLPAGIQLSEDNRSVGTHMGELIGATLSESPTNVAAPSDSPSSEQSESPEDEGENENQGGQKPSTSPVGQDERNLVFGALKEAGYLSYEGDVPTAAAVVLVTGDSDGREDSFRVSQYVDFARALDKSGLPTTVAGRLPAAGPDGLIGKLRTNQEDALSVSTVDSIDRFYGRLATVLATVEQISGGSGSYGTADKTDAVAPA
ncbi:copper transporter [Corynebacterium glucuronolyticum]|uniref:copper transporter n=1 Tax=Corynebacterium glucuronolyticum TaxID=39791 RepID=UPI00191D4CD8|nr:copper transporter [Corynebacterium glucuronolyticum]QQU87436.1 copper transporter [Corynebacterium glucuronolyticum]